MDAETNMKIHEYIDRLIESEQLENSDIPRDDITDITKIIDYMMVNTYKPRKDVESIWIAYNELRNEVIKLRKKVEDMERNQST